MLDDVNKKIIKTQILEYLDNSINDQIVINSFLNDLDVLFCNDDEIHIGIKNPYGLSLLKKEYIRHMEEAVKITLNKNLDVKLFLTDEYEYRSKLSIKAGEEKIKVKSFGVNLKMTFDKWVVSSYNRNATEAVNKVLESPGNYSPLFIYSKSGLGKTHLLHAAANKAISENNNVGLISPNTFTNDVSRAISKGSKEIEEFKKQFYGLDYLFIDDVQILENREKTVEVLFDIFNKFKESGRQIIITADKDPNELLGFHDRFITRFASGLTLDISELKTDDVVKILKQKIIDKHMSLKNWDDESLLYVARNNSSSIRALESSLMRIHFLSGSTNNYSYKRIKSFFKNVAIDRDLLTPDRIIGVVSEYYNIPKKEIIGRSRKSEVVLARHIAMYLIKEIIKCPYKKVGEAFTKRDHSTVMSAIDKIKTRSKINKSTKDVLRKLENRVTKMQ